MKKSEIRSVMRQVAIFEEFIDLMGDNPEESLEFKYDPSGPCDDDPEVDCPFVSLLPDETEDGRGTPVTRKFY